MRILFDKGTLRPLRRRLFGHDVETSVAGFRGRARGSAGGWRPGPLFFAGRGPPALGSGRAVIRAWHFKAGAVNVFSGLRAPAAPSLTVNTAFVSPVGWYLFPGGPVCSPAPCRGLIAPDFPGLVPGLVVLGPVVVWPDAGVSSGARRRLLVPRVVWGWQAIRLDAAVLRGHPRVYGVWGPCHPRACGGARRSAASVRWLHGRSPRLRGNRCH